MTKKITLTCLLLFIISIMVVAKLALFNGSVTPDAEWSLSNTEKTDLSNKALNDNAEAAFRLYLYYKTTEIDNSKAMLWLRKAATNNHASGQYNLAKELEASIGDKEHYKKARYWYNRALKNGVREAQADLDRIKDY